MTPMKWFYSFIKPYRPRIFLGLVLVTFLAALAIINPVVSGHVVDDVISGGQYEKLPMPEAYFAFSSPTILKSAHRASSIK